MLPKGLYGCESCPINDSAMRTWRTETANATTFVTKRKSVDFTFAAASQGTDLDPEIFAYTKRALAYRRAYYICKSNETLINENYDLYKKAGDPGIIKE